jgi:redox-sensitive bicupin YhaK (pirin superfamily)
MNIALPSLKQPRSLERCVTGRPTRDGAGVRLTRVLTSDLQERLDPFLMLDQFGSDDPKDYGAGFPSHPHRGFETVTYMIAGRMRHKDSTGGEGLLQNGGVQWMTAGRGVIHSEMPEQEEGRMEGFQLWLNLPGRDKMCAASYQDIQSADIPEVRPVAGVLVRVIAGSFLDTNGAVVRPAQTHPTQVLYLDVHFEQAGSLDIPLPSAHNAFIYSYRGSTEVGDSDSQTVDLHQMGILANDGDGLRLRASTGSKVLVIAGQPLHEPIAQYGPFVMNTTQELQQAVHDFQTGRFIEAKA